MIEVAGTVAVTTSRPAPAADDWLLSCWSCRRANIPITNKAGNMAAARMIHRGGRNEDLLLGTRWVRRRARRRSGVSLVDGGFKYEENLGSSLLVDMLSLCFSQ